VDPGADLQGKIWSMRHKVFGFGSSNVADSSPMVMEVDCLQEFLDFSSSSWLGFVMLVFLDAHLVPFVLLISACF
jgi:hypothetical protein